MHIVQDLILSIIMQMENKYRTQTIVSPMQKLHQPIPLPITRQKMPVPYFLRFCFCRAGYSIILPMLADRFGVRAFSAKATLSSRFLFWFSFYVCFYRAGALMFLNTSSWLWWSLRSPWSWFIHTGTSMPINNN